MTVSIRVGFSFSGESVAHPRVGGNTLGFTALLTLQNFVIGLSSLLRILLSTFDTICITSHFHCTYLLKWNFIPGLGKFNRVLGS